MRLSQLILCMVLTPFTALAGFVAGAMVMMVLGLAFYENYEYFSPSFGTGAPGIIGCVVLFGAATLGAIVPWLSHLAHRKS